MKQTLRINGEDRSVEAPDDMPLLWVLRDIIGLTGTKYGCGMALCGACTVHLDGKPTRSCVLPISAVRNRPITTIEGVGATPAGARIQKAWLDLEVVQCGYCQSGQIMSASALLAESPTQTMPTSTPRWPGISAVAARTFGSETPSNARRSRDHDGGGGPTNPGRRAVLKAGAAAGGALLSASIFHFGRARPRSRRLGASSPMRSSGSTSRES